MSQVETGQSSRPVIRSVSGRKKVLKAAAAGASLRRRATPARAKSNASFFKTGRGEYGYGDRFLGVNVPDLRAVGREFAELPMPETLILLKSRWHEERLLALLILGRAYARGTRPTQDRIAREYLRHRRYI